MTKSTPRADADPSTANWLSDFCSAASLAAGYLESKQPKLSERLMNGVRAAIDSMVLPPAAVVSPTQPEEPDSAAWWRSIAQKLGVEIYTLREVLGEADRDLHEWLRFARRQMAEMPNWEHTAYGPTSSGIAETERLRGRIKEVFKSAVVSPREEPKP